MDKALAIHCDATSRLKALNQAMASKESDVQRFYSGAVVLITGGSGYMGKQLLEKLFRSCEIRKAYLILRSKKDKSIEDRLSEILKDPAYDGLNQSQPDFKQRIVPVEGDVAKVNLGMSEDNWKDITENVTVILHVAATVKFNEALKTAVLTNVRGTAETLRLAKECRHLRSFVYVSTAYSNATTNTKTGTSIAEQFYPVPISPEVLIHMVDTLPVERLEEITTKLIDVGLWPNTYSFTKAVAEEMVRTVGADLPICIVRPAIVIGAYLEPIPGWIDRRCMHGTNGENQRLFEFGYKGGYRFPLIEIIQIGLACLMGVLHVIICRSDVTVNLIPVDYVNNAIIVAATATEKRWRDGKKETVIYNVTSDRTFLWEHCVDNFNRILSKIPSPKIVGDCFAVKVTSTFGYYILTMLLHFIPAYIIDCITILMGKKPWLTKLYKRIHNLSQVTKYFTLNNWAFDDKNTQQLYHSLSQHDKLIFNFDRSTLDIQKMMTLWALGIRKFVLRDELKQTDYGIKKQILFKLFNLGILFFYMSVLSMFFKLMIWWL